jgi:transcriptional regulator with XRE-family HTH domain
MSTTPTIKDVAEAAGVALSTVSSTLNGKASQRRISPDTQQRVLDVARRLGYQANPTARNMALGMVPASIPQPSPIKTPESQLPNLEIALVLSASSPAESLALIPSLEPVLTAANYRLFVVTLPTESTAAGERLTRMLDDKARTASGRMTVGFLCCPTVYSTVSTLLVGRCPAIVLWQGAAKAMVATLADPSATVPVPPVVPPVVVPPPVIPSAPLPITPTPPPAPVVTPPVVVAPEPAPPPSQAPEPVIIPEPAPVVMETPVAAEPVSQQESGSAGGFALPEEKPVETVEIPTEPVTPREPDPTASPEPELVVTPEPVPVTVETPVTGEPVAQQDPGSPEVRPPEEIPAAAVETPPVQDPVESQVTPEPEPTPSPVPEPVVSPEPVPVVLETPMPAEPAPVVTPPPLIVPEPVPTPAPAPATEPEPIAPVAPTPAPVPEPTPEVIPEPIVVPIESEPGSLVEPEAPAPEEVQPAATDPTP